MRRRTKDIRALVLSPEIQRAREELALAERRKSAAVRNLKNARAAHHRASSLLAEAQATLRRLERQWNQA